jgi:hypothetical protein
MRTYVPVSLKGRSYSRLNRALQTGKLSLVLAKARGVPHMDLDEALEIRVLIARARHPSFDRAATRWVGRLLAERPVCLGDARHALALVERLSDGREPVGPLARRA